jgi:hypothetical protein
MASTLARTSAIASMTGVPSWNSMKIWLKPSLETDVIFFTPSTEFTSSSIFLVTSRSTASGEAPAYSVVMPTNGKSTLGHRSTDSRR